MYADSEDARLSVHNKELGPSWEFLLFLYFPYYIPKFCCFFPLLPQCLSVEYLHPDQMELESVWLI